MSLYLSTISLYLLAVGLFLFPLLYLPLLSDPFILPKQAVVVAATFIALLLWGLRMLMQKKVTLRLTPLLLPLSLLLVVIFISSLVPLFQSSGNNKTSLIAAYPLLTTILLYFVMVATTEKVEDRHLLTWALFFGATLASLLTILSFFKLYPLPLEETKVTTFNSFGNLFQNLLFLAALLPKVIFDTLSSFRKRETKFAGLSVMSTIIGLSLLLIFYQLFISPPLAGKPLLLPQEVGLRVATGSIGQNFQTLLLGTGPGTYLSDFTQFRAADLNQYEFWNVRFLSSSSFVLEILTTMGLLGLFAFLFLAYRFFIHAKRDRASAGIVVLFLASLVVPLSFPTLTLLFILLALYASEKEQISEVVLHIVALGKTVSTNIMPLVTLTLVLPLTAFSLYYTSIFLLSDYHFKNAIVAASQNRGTETYNSLREAIRLFPYRDGVMRSFSQTNLAVANAIAGKGEELTDQDRQTIVGLVQQAISSGRSAVVLYPQNVFNWENLAAIYRSLIGFGQNADTFAIASAREAVRLDPANPQLYLFLGGIYYQLSQWDQAQNQFQIAANLKPDFANARYNLGHALENKDDLKAALTQYQAAQSILANSPADQPGIEDNQKKLSSEIEILKKRIGEREATTSAQVQPGRGEQPPLSISAPQATFPPQRPPVQIPQPPISTESAR